MDKPPATLHDIARALGTSIGTVHRALHNNPEVSPTTRAMALRMAKTLGYRPNLSARYLSSKTGLHIWVNTLQGTTSFREEVRAGSRDEAARTQIENIKLDFQTYHQLGDLQEKAFELAIANKVDGIITFPSHPRTYCPASRRRKHFDAPGTVVPKAI